VHRAPLPRSAEHLRQRDLQPRMRIADRQLHTDQAASHQAPKKLTPEGLGLSLTDIQADDLPPTGLMHRVSYHHALARDATAVADLLDLRVDEQVRIAASNGRVLNACTCSSSPAQMRLTSLRETRSPSDSTSWSTRRVDTPHTYACCTTDTNACSERCRGCRNDGK
jgi:hypothetical protein